MRIVYNRSLISFILILVGTLVSCSEEDQNVTMKRIASIQIDFDQSSNTYDLDYDDDKRLLAISIEDNQLVEYLYNDNRLAGFKDGQYDYQYHFNGDDVVRIDRIPHPWPDDLSHLPRHFREIRYEDHQGSSCTRIDSSVFYDYSDNNYPAITSTSLAKISEDFVSSSLTEFKAQDTFSQIQFAQSIIYSPNAANPIKLFDFPKAYNPILFQAFNLSEFVVRFPEVLFDANNLPRTIKIIRDGVNVRTSTFIHEYKDGLLSKTIITIDDHPGGPGRSAPGYPVERILSFTWE